MTERRIEDKFVGIAKSLKEIAKANDKLNISLSKFNIYILSICDGDNDD